MTSVAMFTGGVNYSIGYCQNDLIQAADGLVQITEIDMRRVRRAVTLIELLVVIGIIGLLIQLMLPAVIAARESARRTQCQDNLRQIGLACLLHENAVRRLPSGGWGFLWVGDPDRGDDRHQPGGWAYNILPFIEQQSLHELGKGMNNSEKRNAVTEVCTTALPVYLCPSRRRAKTYQYRLFNLYPLRNTSELSVCTKADYAANAGDYYIDGPGGPETLAEGDSEKYEWLEQDLMNGIIFQRSEIELRHIKDGMTNTYLIGEKHLEWKHYKDGHGGGDDQTAFVGYDQDVNRWTSFEGVPNPPLQDQRDKKDWARFGSAHPAGCNFVFCDGSVRAVSYDVDGELHRGMGPRNDGQPSTD